MTTLRTHVILGLLTVAIPLCPRALAQGRTDVFNVESPLVHPLEIAQVGGAAWLLVANTPDASVEIWSTDETIPVEQRLVDRVRVGQEPVSVRWNPALQRFYTADFLGDSVSVVRLLPDGESVRAVFETTAYVGDEPMDVAFDPVQPVVWVTLDTSHALARRHALTLAPLGRDGGVVPLVDATASPPRGLREPHVVLLRGDSLFSLGFKGGHGPVYDLDLFVSDLDGSPRHVLSGFGTTNWSMAFADDGALFVAGAEAHDELATEPAVAAAPTGFVESRLVRVDDPSDPGSTIAVRDLNAQEDGTPVPRDEALAMPTDVVVFEPDASTRKVFVAAFGSDRLGIVEPVGDAASWPLRRLDLAPPRGSAVAARGPRGLALKPALPNALHDPGARLYVLGRFTHDVTIVDPVGEQVLGSFPLSHDPTPPYIQQGRPWLYSARLTSGNGFDSCASCHTDARTDGLLWNLGTPGAPRPPFPLALTSGLPGDQFGDGDCLDDNKLLFDDFVVNGFPPKFDMYTQSLQGLVNYEVDPAGDTTAFFTNASYHWRADRPGLESFNGAFVSLLGLDPQPGTVDQGLDPTQLAQLVEFVNSIAYPPNPLEPVTRVYAGDMGDPDDPLDGEGALAGLEAFHTAPMGNLFGLSCVGCHQFPEASDNRITVMAEPSFFFEPLETAALRGLLQKEVRRDAGPGALGDVVLGEAGLTHRGANLSIVEFDLVFSDELGGRGDDIPPALADLNEFVRGLDWGVAPMVGRALTVSRRSAAIPGVLDGVDLLEGQALVANVDAVARAVLATGDRGFLYDVTATPPAWREQPSGATSSLQQVLTLLKHPDDRIVFEAVPLGSGRRLAVSERPAPLSGPAPSEVTLLPMVPNTAYAPITLLHKNVSPFESPALAFTWTNPCAPTPRGPKALRVMQWGLLQDAAPEGAFGLPGLRHEAPRRLRVAARDLRFGASLHLFMPDGAPPDTSQPLEASPTREIALNLHATGGRLGDLVVWETAVELDPLTAYALMLGGPDAPGVALAAYDTFDVLPEPPPAGTFDPLVWNWYWVSVRNADGSEASGGWQRLTIAP